MTTRQKTKQKKMDMEGYFRAIQEDIARMATKEDLARVMVNIGDTKAELALLSTRTNAGFKELREDIQGITETMVTKVDFGRLLREELEKFFSHARA